MLLVRCTDLECPLDLVISLLQRQSPQTSFTSSPSCLCIIVYRHSPQLKSKSPIENY